MKKNFIIFLGLFFIVLSSPAFAHSPTDIIFNYDARTKILSVGVAHSVEDAQKHFIKEITIKVNGKEGIEQQFASQVNINVQAASYAQVDLKKGDIIEVLAVCNKSGQLKKKFEIK